MDIEVWSVGSTKFTADPEFQDPMIREAIDQRGDVASVIIDYTDSDRDRITYDEYARVTGDVPGLVLFEGWLTGDRDAPPPPAVTPSVCGHEFELGGSIYTCERAPHPVDGYLRLYRHAAGIDAELAVGTDEGDGNGPADLVTWGEDGAGDGQDWEVAWGSVAEWQAGLSPEGMSASARAARAAFLSARDGNRLGSSEAWNAAAQAVLDSRTPWGDVDIVVMAMGPKCAVVQSGGPDGDVVKVISYGDTGLAYFDSVEEWQAANDAGPSPAPDAPERPREGWSRIIPPQKKSHYFVSGRSLCGRFGFPPEPLTPDDCTSPDDCAACRKKVNLRKLDQAALAKGSRQ